MRKNIFYNNKEIEENLTIKSSENLAIKIIKKSEKVNINSLLNRVKIEKKNENKKKIIFFSFGILLLGLMGIFVTIVR
ncbi:hypothetical protein N9308_01805 [Candidatus Pelagibacter sp.]|jgi:hypothetical protein|nr:hypothetical protein [Candidatus Pelagibacter sp.]|tara:strand:- start:468 stop:701 length:234 start_codon:yes stop_codon:yes gene_type:complete